MLQELSLKSNINKNKTIQNKKGSLDLRTFSWSIGAILAQSPACIKKDFAISKKVIKYSTKIMASDLKRINAYPEFRTAGGIDTVRNAVIAGVPPPGTPKQQARFDAKFLNPPVWVVTNVPAVPGGHGPNRLRYRPGGVDLLVAYPDEKQAFMTLVYNDNRRGLGIGLEAFYQQVAMSYLNIKKKETDAFLRGQGDYQIAKVPHKQVISPIVAKAPNERWGMDLIDMSFGTLPNRTNRYILTVIDYFSGYVWARLLPNKRDVTIRARLNNIINTAFPTGSSGTYPRILQTDNGTEFRNATLNAYTTAHNINHIFTTSYSPESNGKVERTNREVRKKIKVGNIRRNNHTWLNHLPAYIDNINSQMNARSKMTAKQLWVPGYNAGPAVPPPLPPLAHQNTPAERRAIQRHYLEDRSVGWQHGAMPTFQVGDLVRVNLASLSTEYRRSIKEHRSSGNAVHWSPVISRIAHVYPVNVNRVHPRYSITVGPAGPAPLGGIAPPAGANQVLQRGAVPWLFAGNQLTLAGTPTSVNPRNITRVNFINSRN